MDKNFTLKKGKHQGKTIKWIEENAPSYIAWAKENAPNLLKESKPKPPPKPIEPKAMTSKDISPKTMTPNMNFWNEGPDDMCKPYLERMKENNDERK